MRIRTDNTTNEILGSAALLLNTGDASAKRIPQINAVTMNLAISNLVNVV